MHFACLVDLAVSSLRSD